MDLLIDVILRAGRSAVELSFFVLLPVMVVMLSLMRLLEARGVLDWVVARLAPLLRPLGLTGLGVFAALQINFVSFAAPVATLAMMDQRGASSRHLAATLAMVMAMAQANVSMPMAAMGLHFGVVSAGRWSAGWQRRRPPTTASDASSRRPNARWTKPFITRWPKAPRACST
jgi:spore maturation protein SpmB